MNRFNLMYGASAIFWWLMLIGIMVYLFCNTAHSQTITPLPDRPYNGDAFFEYDNQLWLVLNEWKTVCLTDPSRAPLLFDFLNPYGKASTIFTGGKFHQFLGWASIAGNWYYRYTPNGVEPTMEFTSLTGTGETYAATALADGSVVHISRDGPMGMGTAGTCFAKIYLTRAFPNQSPQRFNYTIPCGYSSYLGLGMAVVQHPVSKQIYLLGNRDSSHHLSLLTLDPQTFQPIYNNADWQGCYGELPFCLAAAGKSSVYVTSVDDRTDVFDFVIPNGGYNQPMLLDVTDPSTVTRYKVHALVPRGYNCNLPIVVNAAKEPVFCGIDLDPTSTNLVNTPGNVFAGYNGWLTVWRLRAGQIQTIYRGRGQHVRQMAAFKGNFYIAFIAEDGSEKLMTLADDTATNAPAPPPPQGDPCAVTVTQTVTQVIPFPVSVTNTVTITNTVPIGSGLRADFSFSPQPAFAPAVIVFSDTTAANIVSRRWEFGDGSVTTTAGKSTGHGFGAWGNYSVKLTVTDSYGNTASTNKPVTISPRPIR